MVLPVGVVAGILRAAAQEIENKPKRRPSSVALMLGLCCDTYGPLDGPAEDPAPAGPVSSWDERWRLT